MENLLTQFVIQLRSFIPLRPPSVRPRAGLHRDSATFQLCTLERRYSSARMKRGSYIPHQRVIRDSSMWPATFNPVGNLKAIHDDHAAGGTPRLFMTKRALVMAAAI